MMVLSIRQKSLFLMVLGLVLLMFMFMCMDVHAQGIPRSKGFALRGMFWGQRSSSQDYDPNALVNVTGFGASLALFSRFADRWFFELSLGAVEDTHVRLLSVEAGALVPVLFGVRYDLMPSRRESNIQPYVKGGVGAYWLMNATTGLNVNVSTDTRYGLHVGGGVNVVLLNWLGFNCEVKYHLVNLESTPVESLTGFEFGIGWLFMWGSRKEFFRIQDVKVIVQDVYPAYSQFYTSYPIAMVTVRNVVNYPIEVNVVSEIQGYTERARESGFLQIEPYGTKDIPIYVQFGRRFLNAEKREPAAMDIRVEVRTGATHTKSVSRQIMIHDRNAWNGDIDKLSFFVTPDEDGILGIGRGVAETLEDPQDVTYTFVLAQRLFAYLGQQDIRFHSDPNIPYYQDDRVQFADETLVLKTGDCDDLVVLCSSLLESVGIRTGFVDVQDPGKNLAHVYLMFDTGLSPEQGSLISSNEKRYVVRENRSGRRSIWVPVEATLIHAGFDAAWESGAIQYLQEGVLRNGLSEGWVSIIDVN